MRTAAERLAKRAEVIRHAFLEYHGGRISRDVLRAVIRTFRRGA